MKKYLKINKSPSFQQLAEQVKGKILSQSMDQKEREQVQTFRAGSLREALALVRREVGPDALILRQHREGYQVCVDVCLELPSAAADLDAVAEAQQESVPHSPRPVEPDDTHSQINAVSVDALVTQNPVTSISAEFNSQLESLGYSSYTIAALSSGQDLRTFVVLSVNGCSMPISPRMSCRDVIVWLAPAAWEKARCSSRCWQHGLNRTQRRQ